MESAFQFYFDGLHVMFTAKWEDSAEGSFREEGSGEHRTHGDG